LASANSGVSRKAVLATAPTIAIAAPIQKAIRQFKPKDVKRDATASAATVPTTEKIAMKDTIGYCIGGSGYFS
jgi:hypothetical protein